jgi:hypothetical protein
VAAQLGRPANAEDFLISCFPFLSNFVKTLNTLNNSNSEQGTACLRGGVRDQIKAIELTGWSASGRGGCAAGDVGARRRMGASWGVRVGAEAKRCTRAEAGAWRPGRAVSVDLSDLSENGGVSRGRATTWG